MSKIKIILFLFFIDLFLLVSYFGLKIYFQPIAIVVPHHDIVKEKRLEFFQKIANKRISTKKIILIGPDHFSPIQNNLNYSNINWELPDNQLLFLKEFESYLNPLLNLQDGVIKNDHAVYNLVSDINFVWPNAKFFPILIGQNYPISKLDNLISRIQTVCNFDCLLISSVDFSHYLPSALANVHDQKSIYDLSIQNLEEIAKLEVDSPQSLYVLAKFSKLKKASNWDLFYHSNSGDLTNNSDVETTSHVLGSYQKIFKKNNYPKIETHLVSKNIDRQKSLNSLGARFFYGTDFIDLNYSGELPDNLALSIIISDGKPVYSFFPTKTINGATYLLRGEEKITKLNEINSANIIYRNK